MRWMTRPPRPRRYTRRWFAWYPREADDGFTYWLCWLNVTREWVHHWGGGNYEVVEVSR